MACYFIARIDVHDADRYQRYLQGAGSLLERFGATVLAVDETTTVLEGEWPATRTVLLAFPDEATANAWYTSPEYRLLAQHRYAASSGDAVLVKGREPSAGA